MGHSGLRRGALRLAAPTFDHQQRWTLQALGDCKVDVNVRRQQAAGGRRVERLVQQRQAVCVPSGERYADLFPGARRLPTQQAAAAIDAAVLNRMIRFAGPIAVRPA